MRSLGPDGLMTTVTMENAPQLLAEAQKARRAGDTANLVRLADALLAFAPLQPRGLVCKAHALGAGQYGAPV